METQDIVLPIDYPTCEGSIPHFGYVYFIYCAGRIKIGRAEDVSRRLSQIATGSPFKPALLLSASAPRSAEKELHARFAEDRIHREWFKLSDHLRRYLVRRLNANGLAAFRAAEEEFLSGLRPEPASSGMRKWKKPLKRCGHGKPLSRSCARCTREAALKVYDELKRKLQ